MKGLTKAFEENTCTTTTCDIVLPVCNGLTYVKECIDSIISYTPPESFWLYIIDDCSDTFTSGYLKQRTSANRRLRLHRNERNLGFLKSCNLGIQKGSCPYVVLINSDVIVTPHWLERLVACAESDARIASVNPLTNYASQINVPIVPGANFYAMDWYLERHSPRRFPDVVTGVGFCMLLRRTALAAVGLFDEIYGRGYCEESDLCMRLTQSGYRTVVADHVYVYHKGRATFTDRDQRYLHNRRIFDTRWSYEYRRQYRQFCKANPLRPVRSLFAMPQRWDPMPTVWQAARETLACWRDHDPIAAGRASVRGLLRAARARREIPDPAIVERITQPGRMRVTYVLHNMVVAGGVLSVIQLVNELILLGIEARIVTLYEDPAIYDWTKLLTRPMVFRSVKELIANLPTTDIAVATLWNTAPWVSELVNRKQANAGVYFIQDYEPWFFPEEDRVARAQVKASYRLIQNRIVKSDWLQNRLTADGYASRRIRLGMDLARFYPRDTATDRSTVLAMARPGTPRRGFPSTIEALAEVKRSMPEVEIILFGDRFLSSQNIPFSFRDEGVVTDQNRLAELYSQADVFLDGSDFQGFGRCALEAMACATACVLTSVGGVMEYARHGENAIVVPPRRPDIFARAIIAILSDFELKTRLAAGGLATAQAFCHKREARETLAYFQEIAEASHPTVDPSRGKDLPPNPLPGSPKPTAPDAYCNTSISSDKP